MTPGSAGAPEVGVAVLAGLERGVGESGAGDSVATVTWLFPSPQAVIATKREKSSTHLNDFMMNPEPLVKHEL